MSKSAHEVWKYAQKRGLNDKEFKELLIKEGIIINKAIMKKTAESVLISARENNEPILVLRAKDKCSVKAIQAYQAECRRIECDESHISGIQGILEDFALWRANNMEQVKKPD